ncbi:MAG: hypothetical protein PHO67_08750 [Candidatus Omnitrophica bacterium]|nr:hypothetical protein [Candidatus Omnitrophota bacterium]
MKYVLGEDGRFTQVENFRINDFVAYAAVMGGPIVSRGHKIVAFKMIDPAKEIFKVGITNVPGYVPLENILLDGHCYEVPNESNVECISRLAKAGTDMVSTIETFLSLPIDQGFQKAVSVFDKVDKQAGILMAEAVIRKMKRSVG